MRWNPLVNVRSLAMSVPFVGCGTRSQRPAIRHAPQSAVSSITDDPATKPYEGIQLNPQPVPQPTAATDLVNIELVVTEK